MSKTLIVLMVGLLAVGCEKSEVMNGPVDIPKPTNKNSTTAKPVKETTKETVAGAYESKEGAFTFRWVFLDNRTAEYYANGKKTFVFKWSIEDGKIHATGSRRGRVVGDVYRINPDGGITGIAAVSDGKLKDTPIEKQTTYKKIK